MTLPSAKPAIGARGKLPVQIVPNATIFAGQSAVIKQAPNLIAQLPRQYSGGESSYTKKTGYN
jgi:hypothetical protein